MKTTVMKKTASERSWIPRIVIGLVLAGLCAVAPGESEAVPFSSLPPDVQQLLQAGWMRAPVEARQQGLIAIQRLSPSQAQQAVANLRSAVRSVGLNNLMQVGQFLEGIRGS